MCNKIYFFFSEFPSLLYWEPFDLQEPFKKSGNQGLVGKSRLPIHQNQENPWRNQISGNKEIN
jgi:hypothetical protein